MTAPRKTILALFILCCIAVAGFFWWLLSGDKETEYRGRKLSYWAQAVNYSTVSSLPDTNDEAVVAIRAIGTNALPVAIRWLETDDRDRIKKKCARLVDHINLRQKLFNFEIDAFKPKPKWQWAHNTFTVLGTNAAPAIPAIIQIMKGKDENAAMDAVSALRCIGPPSVPYLLVEIKSTNRLTIERAIYLLMILESNAVAAVPVLVSYLENNFNGLADYSALALARIKPDSNVVIPAAINRFNATQPNPSRETLALLKSYGFETDAVSEAQVSASSTNQNRTFFAYKQAVGNLMVAEARYYAQMLGISEPFYPQLTTANVNPPALGSFGSIEGLMYLFSFPGSDTRPVTNGNNIEMFLEPGKLAYLIAKDPYALVKTAVGNDPKEINKWRAKLKNQLTIESAYQLATLWLKSVEVEVDVLEKKYSPQISQQFFYDVPATWKPSEPPPPETQKTLLPTFDVCWGGDPDSSPPVWVSIDGVTRELIHIRMEDTRFSRRKPIIVTNSVQLLNMPDLPPKKLYLKSNGVTR